MKLDGHLTLPQIIDWMKLQESMGLSLAQCITKLEQEELPKVTRPSFIR